MRNDIPVDFRNVRDGVYMVEEAFGAPHKLKEGVSLYGDKDYEYVGRIHKGEICFRSGKDMSKSIPAPGDWDYGYTLEGIARDLFEVEGALVNNNGQENREFAYIGPDSKLKFVGNVRKKYKLYVRCFTAENSEEIRWLVLYAEEA
ncbi:MAG: hypothetical protein WCR16_01505 [Bacilli bacterium]